MAALGDGGALMAAAELETVVRLGLPMVVVVYDDAAYGAEVHHFGPPASRWTPSTFPDTDIAAIGARLRLRGGHRAQPGDLAGVAPG